MYNEGNGFLFICTGRYGVWSGDLWKRRAELQSGSYSTTLGQELKDLKDAYEKGIITEKQYETTKEKLIEQRTGK
jgi:hypothetical protein